MQNATNYKTVGFDAHPRLKPCLSTPGATRLAVRSMCILSVNLLTAKYWIMCSNLIYSISRKMNEEERREVTEQCCWTQSCCLSWSRSSLGLHKWKSLSGEVRVREH